MISDYDFAALVHYEPDTGRFFWNAREVRAPHDAAWNTRYAGRQTGHTAGPRGDLYIRAHRRSILAHRLAWFISYGRWPHNIDHINRDFTDNRLANLREVTPQENSQNRAMQANNSSGCIGVFWAERQKAWRAQIGHRGQRIYLGYFKSKDAARDAYRAAKAALHTFHPIAGDAS